MKHDMEPWPTFKEISKGQRSTYSISLTMENYDRARMCVNLCAGLSECEIEEAIDCYQEKIRYE